ncbi:MAG: VacJ family lipoprotein [Proteobacteria bacterium]|jgi:phospholipid-binding lipoprotein MlaA|nr:VacJ family lipoprotein [Ramlibacter sp.]MCA0211796.1 VacJ family lipoprotein [Pseudomonadota bacterium]
MTTVFSLPGARAGLWAALAALVLLTTGCAARGDVASRDPFERWNRGVSEFNDNIDSVVLKPVAVAYREVTPPTVRTGVSNFFGNLGDFWSFVNSALQFKWQNAAENLMRVNVNTFFGLGGILDVASEMNIDRHREDFGQTLGRWGVPAGPYLVLPLLGPSTLRDTLALPVDRRGDPVQDINPQASRNATYLLRAVDARSNLLRASAVLDEAALDKYSFTRDAYLQRRRAELFDGNAPDPAEPPEKK